MKSAVAMGVAGFGIALLVLSTIWASLSRAESNWTEEKANRSIEVKARLAYLGGQINNPKRSMHAGPDPAELKTEFDALKKESEQLNAEFSSVAERPNTIAKYMKWTGIGLAALGLIGWFAVKEA